MHGSPYAATCALLLLPKPAAQYDLEVCMTMMLAARTTHLTPAKDSSRHKKAF